MNNSNVKRLLSICFMILIVACSACNKVEMQANSPVIDDDISSFFSTLTSEKWKLTQFVDKEIGEIISIDTANHHIFTISFITDSTFEAVSSANDIYGTFTLDSISGEISIDVKYGTEVMESQIGEDYVSALGKSDSLALSGKELKLFYDNSKYLHFKRIKK